MTNKREPLSYLETALAAWLGCTLWALGTSLIKLARAKGWIP